MFEKLCYPQGFVGKWWLSCGEYLEVIFFAVLFKKGVALILFLPIMRSH